MRLYAVVRGDLDMTPGKMAAQAGHAYLNSYLKAQTDYPEQVVGYQEGGVGTKVCLKASSEMDLEKIFIIASKSGVPCSRIEDSGHVIEGTVFDGSSILTAVGIGPIRRDQAKFLRKLKLVC